MKVLTCWVFILFAVYLYEVEAGTSDCSSTENETTGHHCSSGFTHLHDRCYHFSTVAATWYTAFQNCVNLGANLASLDTLEENAIVKAHVKELDSSDKPHNWWLSATDDSQEGVFVWANNMNHVTHTDWCYTDPNNYFDESCVYLFGDCDYQWEDRSCDFPSHYICEER